MDKYIIDRIIENRRWEAEVKEIFAKACALLDSATDRQDKNGTCYTRFDGGNFSVTGHTDLTPASGSGATTTLTILDDRAEELFSASGYHGYSKGADVTAYVPGRWEDAFNAAAARLATTEDAAKAPSKKITPAQQRERENWGID